MFRADEDESQPLIGHEQGDGHVLNSTKIASTPPPGSIGNAESQSQAVGGDTGGAHDVSEELPLAAAMQHSIDSKGADQLAVMHICSSAATNIRAHVCSTSARCKSRFRIS